MKDLSVHVAGGTLLAEFSIFPAKGLASFSGICWEELPFSVFAETRSSFAKLCRESFGLLTDLTSLFENFVKS